LHHSVAEVVNHCCDGECATEPFVQTRFRHRSCLLKDGFLEASPGSAVVDSIGGRTARAARYYAEPGQHRQTAH
jgi:hypothetical protein